MDPQVINMVVVAALIFLAVSLTLLVTSIMPLLRQGEATLAALQRLTLTVDREVEPIAAQFRDLIGTVSEIKAITAQRVTEVGSKAEAVAGNVNHLVGSAKKQSTVMGAGVLAGIKAYFSRNNNSEESKK
ncbi:MAG: hypothetical protein K2W82_02215 [Candidatus Obscuribacterales bacterium]|nr:hypothetical protein [Candidatus Obscuribacterales bacterium]